MRKPQWPPKSTNLKIKKERTSNKTKMKSENEEVKEIKPEKLKSFSEYKILYETHLKEG